MTHVTTFVTRTAEEIRHGGLDVYLSALELVLPAQPPPMMESTCVAPFHIVLPLELTYSGPDSEELVRIHVTQAELNFGVELVGCVIIPYSSA